MEIKVGMKGTESPNWSGDSPITTRQYIAVRKQFKRIFHANTHIEDPLNSTGIPHVNETYEVVFSIEETTRESPGGSESRSWSVGYPGISEKPQVDTLFMNAVRIVTTKISIPLLIRKFRTWPCFRKITVINYLKSARKSCIGLLRGEWRQISNKSATHSFRNEILDIASFQGINDGM